jgi:CBS-domain-containing membrane protein
MRIDVDNITKFKMLWAHHVLQSLLATGVLFVLFLALGEDKAVLISAIGASAFIVFALPHTASAKPKVVIGSHLIGLIAGSIFTFTGFAYYIECPVAVGITILLMVILDVEHPLAAGTAIATVITTALFKTWLAVLVSTFFLSLTRHLLKNYLKNLL